MFLGQSVRGTRRVYMYGIACGRRLGLGKKILEHAPEGRWSFPNVNGSDVYVSVVNVKEKRSQWSCLNVKEE